MASEVKLPRLGQGMEAGTIVKWLKSEGDKVEKGDPLYELDTDKVTQEVEAEASGVLLRIAVAEGEVPVGETIAFIGEEGEQAPEASASGNGASAAQEVDEDPQEEGSPGPAREEERERGRSESGASEQTMHGRQRAGAAGRRPGQGLAARPADRARARHRALVADRYGPRGPDRRRGRRARRRERGPGRSADGSARRGRAARADEHSQDDRPPPDRGVADPGLPAPGLGRHGARERAGRSRCASRRKGRRRRSPTC